jgi:Tfp pilus assembly protein PilE
MQTEVCGVFRLKQNKHLLKNKSGLTLVELIVCSVLILVVTITVANSFYAASKSFIQSRSKFELLNQTKIVENVLRGAGSSATVFSTSYLSNYNFLFEFTNEQLLITARAAPSNPYINITLNKVKSIRLITNTAGNRSRLDYEIVGVNDNQEEYRLSGGIILNNVASLNLNTVVSFEENNKLYIK